MSLPLQAIDHLFDRLAATYGRQWFLMWEGVDASAIKSLWAHELSAFSGDRMGFIAWALENLPVRCPNAIEFKQLCRQAPVPDAPRLPEPKADPERMRRELAKLGSARTKAQQPADRLDWAKRILENPKGRTPTVIAMAERALA